MHAIKMTAPALIVAGVLAVAYGAFSYTRETSHARLGAIGLSAKDTRTTVDIPIWAGAGALVEGVLLLAFGSRKSSPARRGPSEGGVAGAASRSAEYPM